MGFLDALLVRFVSDHIAVELDGMAALVQELIVQPGGAKAGVKLGVRIPLETALIVNRGPTILLVRLALINIAELIGGVVNLVALRIIGEELLKQDFRPAFVIDVIVAPSLALVSHGSLVEVIGFGNVVGGLERGRGDIQLQSKSLLANAVKLNQLFLGPPSSLDIADD